MDNDYNQQEQELNQLRQQLSETLNAEEFFRTPIGELWTRLANLEITKLIRDITSDKYDKDHNGYLNAKAELKVWRAMLGRLMIAGSPMRKAKIEERLATAEGNDEPTE